MANEIPKLSIIQGPVDGTDAPSVQFVIRPEGDHESVWPRDCDLYYVIDGGEPTLGNEQEREQAKVPVGTAADGHVNLVGLEPGGHIFEVWLARTDVPGEVTEYRWVQSSVEPAPEPEPAG